MSEFHVHTAYQSYKAWCASLGIKPASYQSYRHTTGQIGEGIGRGAQRNLSEGCFAGAGRHPGCADKEN
jgi:hypothetical protein